MGPGLGNARFGPGPSTLATGLLPVRAGCPTLGIVISRLARPAVLIPLAIALVLVGLGAWWLSRAGSSTQVSEEQAARDYGAGGAATPAGAPKAGVWTYTARGDETVGLGALEIDRELPREARVVVRPAPDGYWRTLALSEEHVEASRLRAEPRGEYLVERVTTLKVAGVGRDDREVLKPPPLAYPRSIEVGDTWTERYVMDEVRVVTRVRVLRSAPVKVGARDVPTVIIDKRGAVSGPLTGFRNDRIWWSDDLKMPVRWVISTEIDGFASLRTDADLRLAASEPTG